MSLPLFVLWMSVRCGNYLKFAVQLFYLFICCIVIDCVHNINDCGIWILDDMSQSYYFEFVCLQLLSSALLGSHLSWALLIFRIISTRPLPYEELKRFLFLFFLFWRRVTPMVFYPMGDKTNFLWYMHNLHTCDSGKSEKENRTQNLEKKIQVLHQQHCVHPWGLSTYVYFIENHCIFL